MRDQQDAFVSWDLPQVWQISFYLRTSFQTLQSPRNYLVHLSLGDNVKKIRVSRIVSRLTSCFLHFLQPFSKCRAIFQLQAIIICIDRIFPSFQSMESSTLACITLWPGRIGSYTLMSSWMQSTLPLEWINIPPQHPLKPHHIDASQHTQHFGLNKVRD